MAGRPARADALRNREKLLAAALAALSTGTEEVSLEAIARDAGVGIGTLYRNFPTRAALVQEVFRSELDGLCASADRLLSGKTADVALRAWMQRYADFGATKQGMADAVRATIPAGLTVPTTWERLTGAVQLLLDAGAQDGSLRRDVPADDVLTALAGIVRGSDVAAHRAQVGRLLDLLLDGLRAGRR